MTSVDDVPWNDPDALEQWVRNNRDAVAPEALGRLLRYNGFEEVQPPTRSPNSSPRVTYAPLGLDRFTDLANFHVDVYYSDHVAPMNIRNALIVLAAYRDWRRLHPAEAATMPLMR